MADISVTTSDSISTLIEGLNLTDEQIAGLTQNLATWKLQTLQSLDEDITKAKNGTRLTKQGFDLVAKGTAGQEIRYTRAAFGDSTIDGQMIKPSDETCSELTELIHERMSLPLASVSFTGGGCAAIKFAVQNQNVDKGFFVRELGIYAIDPDSGEEILYCYKNSGICCDFIPGGDGSIIWNFIMTIITVIGEATNVTAVIDANLAFVSQSEFLDHVNSTNPHPNFIAIGNDVTTSPYYWATGEDNNLHRISLDDLKRVVLGGDAVDIPKIDRRLRQTEINLANILMQLQADDELGIKGNLTLIEDFSSQEDIDTYSRKVLSQVAGVNNINLENDQNILNGHWYTITDGIHAEYVQVKSVAKNGGNFVVMLEDNLIYTYNLNNTTFIRSSALFENGMATGAGDIRGITYNFTETFRGTGGNLQTTLQLETTQKNSSSFELIGDAAFTTNGEFTLSA